MSLDEALVKDGFQNAALPIDGKLHRFGENKNCWFIGWRHDRKKGEPLTVAVYGDWKRGQKFEYKSEEKLSREENKVVQNKIREAAERAESERRAVQESVAGQAQTLWLRGIDNASGNPEFLSGYLVEKHIRNLHAARINPANKSILVPVRDIKGKLWGIQTIDEDGTKRFMPGQRVQGCMHIIGGPIKDEVIVCEGFATGATIHECTGRTVAVGFYAGNLGSVCQGIRSVYPECKLLIAGDDDKWSEGNAGRAKATEAANAFKASVIFPRFQDESREPTDFNDLMVLQGPDEVHRQIGRSEPKGAPFVRCLGFDKTGYYYMGSDRADIICLPASAHTSLNLLRLMPLDYWEQNYAGKNEHGVNWTSAASDLISRSHEAGYFKMDSVRGLGVWRDGGGVVVNCGNSIWRQGRHTPILAFQTPHLYASAPAITLGNFEPLEVSECSKLINAVTCLNWKNKECAAFFLGFLVVCRFAGSLKWRPHIWVSGSAGSGKSTIMETLLRTVAGPLGLMVLGNTSEAGLRQSIGSDAKCVLFDEIETVDSRSDHRVKNIMDLVRQASFQGGGSIMKGGKNGDPSSFQTHCCFAFSSIQTNLTSEADVSRFTVLEIEKGNSLQWEAAREKIGFIDERFAEALFLRTLNGIDKLLENIETIADVMRAKFNPRFAQQYSVLLAGYFSLLADEPIDIDTAHALVSQFKFTEQVDAMEKTDEGSALEHILDQKVPVTGVTHVREERTVEQLIYGDDFWDIEGEIGVLTLYGLRVKRVSTSEIHLFVANTHDGLRRWFKDTRWYTGWRNALLRIPGAQNDRMRFGGGNPRHCVRLTLPKGGPE